METGTLKNRTVLSIGIGLILLEWIGSMWRSSDAVNGLIILGTIRLIETAYMLLAVRYFEMSTGPVGLLTERLGDGVKRGFLWSLGFGCICGLIFLILAFFGFKPLKMIFVRFPNSAMGTALFFGVGGIIGPVAEEIFFRGVLYSFFRQWGMITALLITSILFVSLHTTGPAIPVPQLVGGLLFAVAFEVEKNLMVPIVLHTLGNLAIFSLSLLTTT